MTCNVMTIQSKQKGKWQDINTIDIPQLVSDSLITDLFAFLNKEKPKRKIKRIAMGLMVYHDRKNRVIYKQDYSIIAKPGQRKEV